MARAAAQTVASGPASVNDKAATLFRKFVTRPPTTDEQSTLVEFHDAQVKRLTDGQLKPTVITGDKSSTPETAVWVLVARAIMNLDETITKQ